MSTKIVIVAAIGENNAIGKDGQLPWKLRSDVCHFRALTLDKPVIIGRKAFASIGKALMTRLAQRCVDENYARFEWPVLDWNAPSIGFYKSVGAQVMDEWKICRLSGDALSDFAGAAPAAGS